MSNPGEDGYFPLCAACGLGNVHGVVCLDPTCHEKHQGEVIKGARDKFVVEAGHAWQLCQFCDAKVRSDGGAFGTYALCVDRWNGYARKGELPPTAPGAALAGAVVSRAPVDPRLLAAYLDLRLGWKSNRDVVDAAIGLLAEEPAPDWAVALASLRPDEVLEAGDVIEAGLRDVGVLPDSFHLRAAIRARVLALAEGCETLEREAVASLCSRIEALFRLLPDYALTELVIPLVEFPYPPSGIADGAAFGAYLKAHIDEIVGLEPEGP